MGTATKAAKFEMTVNVPVVIEPKYIDLWPDKGYGPQVSVKGVVDGETVTIYMKGLAQNNLASLQQGGVIRSWSETMLVQKEKVNLPIVSTGPVTLNRAQGPKDRYPTLIVEVGGIDRPNGKHTASAVPSETQAPAVQNGAAEAKAAQRARLDSMFDLYDTCFAHAIHTLGLDSGNADGEQLQALTAATATLFIQANQRGIVL